MAENIAGSRQAALDLELPFNLHSGESVELMIKPDKWRFMIKDLAITYILLAVLLLPLLFPDAFPMNIRLMESDINLSMAVPIIVALVGLAAFMVIGIVHDKLTFWITNSRIVSRSGFIGYTIRSIPIDVISDVTIHRGIFDIMLLASDIRMPTISDNIYNLYKHRTGVNHIPSLDSDYAKEVQKAIFHIRDGRRLEESRTYREYFVA